MINMRKPPLQHNPEKCAEEVAAPPPVRRQLDQLTQSLCEILAGNLIGVYLHGSLAMGCFHPAASDLDLLVLTQAAIAAPLKRKLLGVLITSSGHPGPLEISFVHYAQIHPWRHPAPYDLHFGEVHRPTITALLADANAAPPAGELGAGLAPASVEHGKAALQCCPYRLLLVY